MEMNANPAIGFVSGGGLEANLQVRLQVPVGEVQEGAFVVTDSEQWRFYGLVTDIQLQALDERYAGEVSAGRYTPALAKLLDKATLFPTLAVMPALMMERGPEPGSPEYAAWREMNPDKTNPMPVKTLPKHHSLVRLADAADISTIFGEEDGKNVFRVGETREQGHAICLRLDKFVQRSAGIFGTTGSGKSFLARMILAGLIHAGQASTLIFDMHNEYGPDTTSSDTGKGVRGLKSGFDSKVRLVGLGAGTSFGARQPDFTLQIAHADITPEDVLQLSQALNLTDNAPVVLSYLERDFPGDWFTRFMAMKVGALVPDEETGKRVPADDSVAKWAQSAGVHERSAESLRTKLGRIENRGYLVDKPASSGLDDIINNLEAGRHVVLSFGRFDSELDYLLVTNLITRKIRDRWEWRTNEFHKDRLKNPEPRPLVVVVEEAHKLLNREMASQTIFSTIAREMRKYYVTLLIIDQRPSQIYDEVMSQLGTRISGALGDEDDINAVLSGLPGRGSLRGMLAKLQPKEEVLMLGWGVPMPIPLRSRRYDDKFWQDLLGSRTEAPASIADHNSLLGYDE